MIFKALTGLKALSVRPKGYRQCRKRLSTIAGKGRGGLKSKTATFLGRYFCQNHLRGATAWLPPAVWIDLKSIKYKWRLYWGIYQTKT